MSIKAQAYVWEHSKQRGTALLMMLALADFCDDYGACYPGVSRLALKARISKRNARKLLATLEEQGEIRRAVGSGIETSHGKTNRYELVQYRLAHNYEQPLESERGVTEDPPGGSPETPLGGSPETPKPLGESLGESLEDISAGAVRPVISAIDRYEQVVPGTLTGPTLTTLRRLIHTYGNDDVVQALNVLVSSGKGVTLSGLERRLRVDYVPPELADMVIELKSKRPASAAHLETCDYVEAADKISLIEGLSVDDIDGLWKYVSAMASKGKWPSYSVKAAARYAGDYVKARNARARAQEQRAAAPDDPIDYEAMLSASLDRASLYEATGD